MVFLPVPRFIVSIGPLFLTPTLMSSFSPFAFLKSADVFLSTTHPIMSSD